jgi:DNA transposition AAA+ family ATPase
MENDNTSEEPTPQASQSPTPADLTIPVENNGDNARSSWNFSLHQIRESIVHYEAERKQLLISAFLWCTDPKHPVHRDEFARRVQYDKTTIWKIYKGKYVNAAGEPLEVPKKLLKAIRDFLELERERHTTGKNEFVITSTAKRIFRLCDLARESQTPAFIWGPSHCGKSSALEFYRGSNNHGRTTYCRMHAASGLKGMLEKIAASVGVSDNNKTPNLIKYIIAAVTPDMLLILDEVHELAYTYRRESYFACMEVIREIYDETKCGMVLSGTRLMMEQIRGAQHAELEQLLARGVHRLALLSAPTKPDLTAIFAHNKLEFPDRKLVVEIDAHTIEKPYDVIHQLAMTQRLKAITERIRYARRFAAQAGEQLTWRHFLLAHLEIESQSSETPSPEDIW